MSPLEIAIVALAVFVGVAVKAVTGLGLPLIAIPVISLFTTVEDAVAVAALPAVTMNAAQSWRMRREAEHTRDLPTLGALGVVGAVFGTGLLLTLDERVLLLALAAIVFAYVAHSLLRPDTTLSPEVTRVGSVFVGLFAGTMQGAVGICGPPVAAWLHAYRLPPGAFVFSVSLIFFVAGATQLVVLVQQGLMFGPRLWLGLAAIPLVLASLPVGDRLRARLDVHRFDAAILAVLVLSGVSLVVRALG